MDAPTCNYDNKALSIYKVSVENILFKYDMSQLIKSFLSILQNGSSKVIVENTFSWNVPNMLLRQPVKSLFLNFYPKKMVSKKSLLSLSPSESALTRQPRQSRLVTQIDQIYNSETPQ